MIIFAKIKYFFVGLTYENGEPSLTNILAIVFTMTFIGVSLYLVAHGITWGHYSEFATLTAGGGAITQIANKTVNSKYNSPDGKFPTSNEHSDGGK